MVGPIPPRHPNILSCLGGKSKAKNGARICPFLHHPFAPALFFIPFLLDLGVRLKGILRVGSTSPSG